MANYKLASNGLTFGATGAGTQADPTIPSVSIGGSNGTANVTAAMANVFKDLSAVTITTITTVWDPAASKKFRVMGGSVSVSAACSVLFEDNSAGAGNFIYRTPKLAADTPYTFVVGNNGFLSATADNVLKATSSAAAAITGTLWGTEEA